MGTPASEQQAAQVLGLLHAGADVAVVEHLLDAPRDGGEVRGGQAAVGDVALVDAQQLLGLRRPLGVVAEGQHAADVDEEVLLAADRAAVAVDHHLAQDVARSRVSRVARVPQLDHVGVLDARASRRRRRGMPCALQYA